MTKRLRVETLLSTAERPGPCLTVIVPDHHPGMPEGSQANQIRTLAKAAKQKAAGAWPAGFDDALEEFAAGLPDGGGLGVAVFCTEDGVTSLPLQGGQAKAVFASHPHLMPLLAPAHSAHDLFVLGLSTKHVRLLEYVDGVCHPAHLPAGVPTSLDAAGHYRTAAAHGDNRSAAGPGAGDMAGVRFGTSGAREAARDSMEHFCAAIDQGLRPMLAGRPLLLMGVKEEIAAYRRVSHYGSILQAEVEGNVETLTPARIAEIARDAALAEYRGRGLAVLEEFREMRDRARTVHDPRAVLQAAVDGRVHKLCVREGIEAMGPLEPQWDMARLPAEDLVNAAAVETLRRGGEVYVLPADAAGTADAVCAILRY